MPSNIFKTIELTELSSLEFSKLSNYIYSNYGIKMPIEKRIMLQSRLQKRLRALNIKSFKEYIDYLFNSSNSDSEIIHMMDVVSTNKTDFFRESQHFTFIYDEVLPEQYNKIGLGAKLKIWSAGCSSGEEVYTLAIIINDWVTKNNIGDYFILGSDISTKVLDSAINAVYPETKITEIPIETKRKYFLKSKDKTKKQVRIISEIRQKVSFVRLNLMMENYPIHEMFDIVFCRNTLIYFDKETQTQVIEKLLKKLKTGGYFFIGHSESIFDRDLPLKQIKPTIYKKV